MFEEPMVFITISLVISCIYSIISIRYMAKGDVPRHYDVLAYYRLFYVIFPIAAVFVGGFKYGIYAFLILFITPVVISSMYFQIKPMHRNI